MKPHKKSVRGIRFNQEGTGLFTASSDKTINLIDLNNGKASWHQPKAHSGAVNAMTLEGNLLFTGDDEGQVKVRTKRKCQSLHLGLGL